MKPIEMPAPSDAAGPTTNVSPVSCVAEAVAEISAGARTDPPVEPAGRGCMWASTNPRRSLKEASPIPSPWAMQGRAGHGLDMDGSSGLEWS